MRHLIRFGVAAACAVVGLSAHAFTYKIASDHTNALYRIGETAHFTVTVLAKDGTPAKAGVVTATLDNFGPARQYAGSWNLVSGHVFHVSGKLDCAGFLRLKLSAPNTKARAWSVGYEPEKIVKGSPSPADFDAFWAEAKARYDREIPEDVQLVRVAELSTPKYDYYRISLATYGRRVHGYLSIPTDKSKAPYPVNFQVNAAGFGAWTNCMTPSPDAIEARFSVYPFEMNWKWRELGLEKKTYDVLNSTLKAKYGCGYATAGIAAGRESYFFYPVILGINRAVDWLARRGDVDRTRFRYQGTSQGGGFGFYLAGLNHTFTRAALYVPALTDTMGCLKGRQSGWPLILENNSRTPAQRAAAEKWAPYFDGANFASRIRCPVRVAVGFSDETCAPCAVYAAYNEIRVADKGIGHGLGMTHSCEGRFYTAFGRWVQE